MGLLRRSDAWAVRRVLAGHPEAFEMLVLRYQKKALAVAQSVGVPSSLLEDVAQDAFLQSFRDLSGLRDPARFSSWFLQIARNTACRLLNRSLSTACEPLPEDACARPEDRLEDKDLREYLRRKVGELPEGVRDAIFLYYYEGEDIAQVASALSISRAAAKKRLQRGREALRGDLWKELQETLRDIIPSAREWKRRGRAMALLLFASIPVSLRAHAEIAHLPPPGKATPALGSGGSLGKGMLFALVLALVGSGAAAVSYRLSRSGKLAGQGVFPPTISRKSAPLERLWTGGHRAEEAATDRTPPAVRLRVQDPEGNVIEEAKVTISWIVTTPRAGGPREPLPPLRTPAGEIRWRERLGDSARFTVGAFGFIPRIVEQEIPPGGLPEPMVVVLTPDIAISGRLIDGRDLKPVPGARVGLVSPTGVPPGPVQHVSGWPPLGLEAPAQIDLLYEVESDEEGRFSLTGLPGCVWVTKDGFGPTAFVVNGDLAALETVLVVPLLPPTTIRVAPRDVEGGKIEGFTFAVAQRLDELATPPFPRRTRGAEAVQPLYHLWRWNGGEALPVRDAALAVEWAGITTRTTSTLEFGKENRVEVILDRREAVVRGRVLLPDGTPAAGARVALAGAESRIALGDFTESQGAGVAIAGPRGDYQLSVQGLSPPFLLVAEHPAAAASIGEVFYELPVPPARQDLQLPSGARIEVQIQSGRHGEGKMPTAVLLSPTVADHRPMLEYRRNAGVDASGGSVFAEVPPGVWELRLEGTAGRNARAFISTAAGRTYQVLLEEPSVEDAFQVNGVLLDRGFPVGGQELRLMASAGLQGRLKSDEAGRFVFTRVSPGEYTVVLYSAPYRQRSFPLQVTARSDPFVLDLTTTRLRGRVLSSRGPLDLVEVRAFEAGCVDGETQWQCVRTVFSAPDGSYRLTDLNQAPLVLVFRREGFLSRRIEWQPRGGVEETCPEVALEPLGSKTAVRFRVVSAVERAEVPSAMIEIYTAERGDTLVMEKLSRSRAEEVLEARGLPAGSYRALVSTVSRVGWRSACEVMEFEHDGLTARELEVRIGEQGAVSLELASEDGLLPGAVEAQVFDRDAGRPLVFALDRPRLRFSGSTVLAGLPARDLEVRVAGAGFDPVTSSFKIVPGRVTRFRLALPASPPEREK